MEEWKKDTKKLFFFKLTFVLYTDFSYFCLLGFFENCSAGDVVRGDLELLVVESKVWSSNKKLILNVFYERFSWPYKFTPFDGIYVWFTSRNW